MVTGFSPLGAGSYVELGMAAQSESALQNSEIAAIAERHGKSPAQVILRWGVQRGTNVVPKTTKAERMAENINIFDFELSEVRASAGSARSPLTCPAHVQEEMAAISALNRNRRFNDPGHFCSVAFNTFFPIYE